MFLLNKHKVKINLRVGKAFFSGGENRRVNERQFYKRVRALSKVCRQQTTKKRVSSCCADAARAGVRKTIAVKNAEQNCRVRGGNFTRMKMQK